ncbi:MAG: hypothetical protein QOD93_888, partial [Acetobacteraceae bacterium]|nr:hypothetical protein [Acetobacteraceae bacterium]
MNLQGGYLFRMPTLGFMTSADFPTPREETAADKEQRL